MNAFRVTMLLTTCVVGVMVCQLHGQGGNFQKEFAKLVTDLKAGKPGNPAAVAKEGAAEDVMAELSKSGSKAGKIVGIERELRDQAKGINKASKEDLVEMAIILKAVTEVTKHYAPKNAAGAKGANAWNGFTKDLETAVKDLDAAAKKGSPADLKAAATKANNACNACHSVFR